MNAGARTLLIVCLSAMIGGCVLEPEIVGEGLTTDSGAGPTSATSTSEGTALVTCSTWGTTDGEDGPGHCHDTDPVTTTGPADGQYGAQCELLGVADPVPSKAISPQPDCAGGICVFAWDDEAPPCASDSDCAWPFSSCGGAGCELDPGVVAENTHCTQSCTADSDCPELPGCASGPVCARVTALGELCCERACLCGDHYSEGTAEALESLCQQPGVCDA